MIDTSKFFFNKTNAVETAEVINELATSKGVQVSRWVNNSKGRQIVTYIVHTGERNDFASKQEGVLFTVKTDAGRGNQVKDESSMMQQVITFLNSIIVEVEEPAYEVTSDLIGDGSATLSDIESLVSGWRYDGWSLETVVRGDEVRVYAERNGDYYDSRPSRYENWTMVTDDYGYVTVAKA